MSQGQIIRRTIAAAACVATLLAACSETPDDPFVLPSDAPTTPAVVESPTPTPTAIDVTTTPDEITPEWVTAVVNTLLAEYGEMGAEVLAKASPSSDTAAALTPYASRLAELFDEEYADRRAGELAAMDMGTHPEFDRLLGPDQFTGFRFIAEVVQFQEEGCLIAVGRLDQSGAVEGGEIGTVLSAFSLRRSGAAVSAGNPTEWVIIDDLSNTDGNGNPNPDDFMLRSDLDTYADALTHDCTGAK